MENQENTPINPEFNVRLEYNSVIIETGYEGRLHYTRANPLNYPSHKRFQSEHILEHMSLLLGKLYSDIEEYYIKKEQSFHIQVMNPIESTISSFRGLRKGLTEEPNYVEDLTFSLTIRSLDEGVEVLHNEEKHLELQLKNGTWAVVFTVAFYIHQSFDLGTVMVKRVTTILEDGKVIDSNIKHERLETYEDELKKEIRRLIKLGAYWHEVLNRIKILRGGSPGGES